MPSFLRIGEGSHLDFLIGPKNTNLAEDVEVWLPVKFWRMLFRGFVVENVSANQRPGGHLSSTIGPKNATLVEDTEILLPVKFN